jgi:isopropylmalate/homocitrate/citramalate synthase
LSLRETLIYDWNAPERGPVVERPFSLLDDTLRDGLQSTVVRQPSLGERAELIGAMARAGVRSVNLGLPVVSKEAFSAIVALSAEAQKHDLRVVVAGRTLESDMRAILELAERTGTAPEGHAFVGSSALRVEVEG